MVFIILLLLITLLRPDVNFFNNGEFKFSQSINNLIPRTDRDNPVDDFETAVSYAMKSQIGVVVTNDPKRSISKESVSKLLLSSGRVGEVNNVEVDDVVLGKTFDGLADRVGSAVSVTTSAGHDFGKLSSVSIYDHEGTLQNGTNYVPGTYYGVRLVGPSTTSGGPQQKLLLTQVEMFLVFP